MIAHLNRIKDYEFNICSKISLMFDELVNDFRNLTLPRDFLGYR